MARRRVYLALAAGGIVAATMGGIAWHRAGGSGVILLAPAEQPVATPSPPTLPLLVPPPLPPRPQLQSGNQALLRFVDPQADPGVPRLGADFMEQVPRIEAPSEFAAVVYVMEDWSENHAIRNEAMNLLWRSQDEPFAARVLALLDRPFESERMRAFFVQHLGVVLPQTTDALRRRIRERLAEALRDRHLAVRREAVGALAEVRDPTVSAALERGPGTSTWDGMHDLAIHLCHRLDLKQHVAAIRAQAVAEDQQVRVAALYVLGQWRDLESRPTMEAAAASPVFQVRRAAEMALARLVEKPQQPSTDF